MGKALAVAAAVASLRVLGVGYLGDDFGLFAAAADPASRWRDASARAERACADIHALGATPDAILLTSPDAMEEIPLWASHTGAAIARCRGELARPATEVRRGLVIPGAAAGPQVTVTRVEAGAWAVSAGGEMVVEQARESKDVLYFDGLALRRAP